MAPLGEHKCGAIVDSKTGKPSASLCHGPKTTHFLSLCLRDGSPLAKNMSLDDEECVKMVCKVPNVAVEQYVTCLGAWVFRRATRHMSKTSAATGHPRSHLNKQSTYMRHVSKQ